MQMSDETASKEEQSQQSRSLNRLAKVQINAIFRDALCLEAFFNEELEGERLDISDEVLEQLPKPQRYLLDMETSSGYQALFYMDALAKQISFFTFFLTEEDIINHMKIPLYIPNDVMVLIKNAFSYSKKVDFKIIQEIHTFYNDFIVDSFLIDKMFLTENGEESSLINMENGSNRYESFIEKMREDRKRERFLIKRVQNFMQLLELHGDVVRNFYKEANIDNIITPIVDSKISTRELIDSIPANKEGDFEALFFSNYLSKRFFLVGDSIPDGENDTASYFYFSHFEKERPIYSRDSHASVQSNTFFTLADMIIYSKEPLGDRLKSKKIHYLSEYFRAMSKQKEIDSKITEEIEKFTFLSNAYAEASTYLFNGKENSEGIKVIKDTLLSKIFKDALLTFSQKVEETFNSTLKALLEKESKKKPQYSIFATEKKEFAYMVAYYTLSKAFKDNVKSFPSSGKNVALRTVEDKQLLRLTEKLIKHGVELYLGKKDNYVTPNGEDESNTTTESNGEDESNSEDESNTTTETESNSEDESNSEEIVIESESDDDDDDDDINDDDDTGSKKKSDSYL